MAAGPSSNPLVHGATDTTKEFDYWCHEMKVTSDPVELPAAIEELIASVPQAPAWLLEV